jgi:hypothetical protein
MIETKFPRRREDGTFSVAARFAVVGPSATLLRLVEEYVAAWARANQTWVRIWRSNVIHEERLSFSEDFLGDPRVEVGSDRSSLSIVLEGRQASRRWKDWLAYLVADVSKIFSELTFVKFDSDVEA